MIDRYLMVPLARARNFCDALQHSLSNVSTGEERLGGRDSSFLVDSDERQVHDFDGSADFADQWLRMLLSNTTPLLYRSA